MKIQIQINPVPSQCSANKQQETLLANAKDQTKMSQGGI